MGFYRCSLSVIGRMEDPKREITCGCCGPSVKKITDGLALRKVTADGMNKQGKRVHCSRAAVQFIIHCTPVNLKSRAR